MALRLVDDDFDVSLEIPVTSDFREALSIQLQRCATSEATAPFEWRLLLSLNESLDGDLQPPTRSQVSYATSIAKVLQISIPAEVLKYKGSMQQFLNYNVPLFKQLTR